MTTQDPESTQFERICRQPHRKMRRCFMTGKTCVYDELVERHLRDIQTGKCPVEGFMVIPYKPNLNAFYDWSLTRFFRNRYGAETEVLKRADQVRRTGYVICEKICRKIQEAAFIVADISVDNANVLYELGIAYGLRQKLIIIHDANSATAEMLKKRYLPDDLLPRVYAYPSIKPISSQESFVQRFYSAPEGVGTESRHARTPRIVLLDLRVQGEQTEGRAAEGRSEDISLTFMDVVKGAVGVAIANIVEELQAPQMKGQLPSQYVDIIEKMRSAVEIGASHDARFDTIRSEIDRSFCVLIRTSKTHQFSYFWLGYCHAVGKNVIPIYEVEDARDKVDDLAFDIRSLWHLVLVKNDPTRILPELQEILKQMIVADFGEWSRRAFWSRVLGRTGRVAIFTGALHNPDFKREMVGDWDLRTASELMSYFSTHQQLATIESPIYQPEKVPVEMEEYTAQIGRLLQDRNAVVIASPDVNPLTELLLGRLYGVPDRRLFAKEFDADVFPTAAAAVKRRKKESADQLASTHDKGAKPKRFFFLEEAGTEPVEKRGFRGNWLPGKELLKDYLGQRECKDKDFELYAHIVVALNPFSSKVATTEGEAEIFVVILNGISGPSTFALTQLLTGGLGGEFVDYSPKSKGQDEQARDDQFNPHATAERILSDITERLENNVGRNTGFCGVQAIVKVTVGPPAGADEYLAFDSRRVKRWEIVPESLKLIETGGKKG